jgi:hypothetical protein
MPRSHRHLAAVLCVLLLNLQLFAANALGCVHGETAPVGLGCPHGGTTASVGVALAPADQPLVERHADDPCQKCNLGTVAAGWHLCAIHPPALASQLPQIPQITVVPRIATRSPDGLLRPPRNISG